MDDLLLFTPSKRFIESTIKEWPENIPKEISVIWDKLALHE